jgi:hypothetical protein
MVTCCPSSSSIRSISSVTPICGQVGREGVPFGAVEESEVAPRLVGEEIPHLRVQALGVGEVPLPGRGGDLLLAPVVGELQCHPRHREERAGCGVVLVDTENVNTTNLNDADLDDCVVSGEVHDGAHDSQIRGRGLRYAGEGAVLGSALRSATRPGSAGESGSRRWAHCCNRPRAAPARSQRRAAVLGSRIVEAFRVGPSSTPSMQHGELTVRESLS